MNNYIAFDLEGVLTRQEYILDLMKLFPEGEDIYKAIKKYYDILAITDKTDYEPSNILKLITPFLILHKVSEANITTIASETVLMPDTLELVSSLFTNEWRIFCITSAVEPYAIHITHKMGIYAHNVACTQFPVDVISKTLTNEEIDLLKNMEETIINLNPNDNTNIKQTFDDFYQNKLPQTAIEKLFQNITPLGRQSKINALKRFVDKYQESPTKWVVVGNDISDTHMLAEVDQKGGLAIAFNADQQALSNATMSLASTHISDLNDILQVWKKGGRKEAKRWVQEKEKKGGTGDRAHFHWLAERDRTKSIDEIIQLHDRIKKVERQYAEK